MKDMKLHDRRFLEATEGWLWLALPNNHLLNLWRNSAGILLWGLMIALWTGGCADTSQQDYFGREGAESLLPKLTSVITGPVTVLLTNGNAFSSEFTMTFEDGTEPPSRASGQIFVLGGKLRLDVAFGKSKRKSMDMGHFGLIWDVAANQGYVFSEAIQGYAPIYATVRFTNFLVQVIGGPTERIEGHLVEKAAVTAMCNNGQTISLQQLRAQDMGNLPLQVESLNSPQSFKLALSRIQLNIPATELFLPPDGFTKYKSEAAILTEIGIRQQSIFKESKDYGDVNIKPTPTGSPTSAAH